MVDFSPKGGPAGFSGVWNETIMGITWEDGNSWPQVNCTVPNATMTADYKALEREMDASLLDKEKCDWLI
jgi:hypothetical protein